MKTLKKFIFFICLSLVVVGFSFSSTIQRLDDTRFITHTLFVDKTADEVIKAIGAPNEKTKDDCAIPIPFKGKELSLIGDSWIYKNENKEFHAERYMCVVDNVVVSEKLVLAVSKDGRTTISSTDTLDTLLARVLFLGKLLNQKPPTPNRDQGIEI